MKKIEVCAANAQSVLAAKIGGAHRIELCSALGSGGITPSPGLIQWSVAQGLPVCVLLRPREGDFVFSPEEIAIMTDDIAFCKQAGAAGVVVGALAPNGTLDLPALERWAEAAKGMELVFHRAFDFVADPLAALDQLAALGFHRILSSGQAAQAWEGRQALYAAVQHANGRIAIMPGSGIDAGNIRQIALATGANEFHLSAKKWVQQPTGRPMPGLEAGYFASQADMVRQCVDALEGL